MKVILNSVAALALMAALVPDSALFGAEPATAGAGDVNAAEFQQPFRHLGGMVTALSRGDIDAAFKHYSEKLAEPPPKEIGEFESDQRSNFRRLFERFPKSVESLDLMAVRRLSSRSAKLTCVANTKQGPVVLEAVTYKYGDDWWYCQLGYQPVQAMTSDRLKSFVDLLPARSLVEPLSIPIRGEVPEKVSSTSK